MHKDTPAIPIPEIPVISEILSNTPRTPVSTLDQRRAERRDITTEIGPKWGPVSGPNPKYPMYSYERPAWIFWQGFYNGLIDCGFSHQTSIEIMQSRDVRHMLDGDGDEIKDMGYQWATRTYKVVER